MGRESIFRVMMILKHRATDKHTFSLNTRKDARRPSFSCVQLAAVRYGRCPPYVAQSSTASNSSAGIADDPAGSARWVGLPSTITMPPVWMRRIGEAWL